MCLFCFANEQTIKILSNYGTKSKNPDHFKLRNEDSYKEAIDSIQRNDYDPHSRSTSGVNQICLFDQIPGFEVTNILRPDPFHDLVEGLIKNDLPVIIFYLFPGKQARNHFESVVEESSFWSNRKPYFNWKILKRVKKIKVNGRMVERAEKVQYMEMGGQGGGIMELFLRLPEFDMQKSQLDSNAWKVYLLLRDIIAIIYSDIFTDENIESLRTNIGIYFRKITKLHAGYNLKPKSHILYHYPYFLQHFGPLRKFDSLRNERFNYDLIKTMLNVNCYKNIPKTVALKTQKNRTVLLESDLNVPLLRMKKLFDFKRYPQLNFSHLLSGAQSTEIFSGTSVLINHTSYCKQQVFQVKGTNNLPTFVQVEKVLQKDDKILFLCVKLKTVSFVRNMFSYKIDRTDELVVVRFEDLYNHDTVLIYMKNDFYYVHKKQVFVNEQTK